ncbi:MAG TPA: hypothetical protein VEJ18_09820, partial [Planctomycetota bacterium]|nr:hypothetical protein [Planctomycetota bacterium]
VEQVVLKAMDRDPARRYASARAFAEDLDAWLDDRPIAARRGAVTRALRRRIRGNPRLVGALGLVLLAAVGVAGVVGMDAQRERRATEDRVRAARDVMKVSVQALLELRRAAANDRMSDFLPDIEAAHRSGPSSADLDYLLGLAYRIVLDDARALRMQESALAKEPRHANARYEVALLRSRRGLPPGPVDGLTEAKRLVLQGGTEALGRAVELNPRLEEAWEGLGLAWLAAAKPMDAPGVQDAALAKAEAAFTEGASHDRGYAPHYLGRGRVRTARAELLRETGRDPAPIFETAEDDFKAAILMGGPVFTARAELRLLRALHRAALGENPRPHFDEALADLEEALKRSPEDPAALALRARLRAAEAEVGGDPLAAFRLGEPDAAAAGPAAWAVRGGLWALRASARAEKGEAAEEDFIRAEKFLDDALRARPGDPEVLERRAWARLLRARAATGNVGELLEQAEADLEKAVAATVFFPRARLTRAAVRRLKAVVQEKAGGPSLETLRSAAEDLMWVLGTNPMSYQAWAERGYVELEAGRQRTRAGDRFGAREPFTQAVRSFEEAARLNGRLAAALREPLREARRALLP